MKDTKTQKKQIKNMKFELHNQCVFMQMYVAGGKNTGLCLSEKKQDHNLANIQ